MGLEEKTIDVKTIKNIDISICIRRQLIAGLLLPESKDKWGGDRSI